MDEEINIINSNTRNEKIKNFFVKNKKKLIIVTVTIIVTAFCYFIFKEFNERNKIKIAKKYNSVSMSYTSENKNIAEKELVEIIKANEKTYSPLALYFLIDNEIIESNEKINELFDIVISNNKLEKEIKDLAIYKKALFNSEFETENNLIKILNPILNSSSIWKSHALYLVGEYFLSKNEKQKAREFFEKILTLDNSHISIKNEAQKRIQNEFTE